MEDSEDMSCEEIKFSFNPNKTKVKKRSLVERELETSLTARVTSPLKNRDATSTSRYGRARQIKSDSEICDSEKIVPRSHKSPKLDKSNKIQSPAYKMHASNSPIRIETPKLDTLENQIENIYNENISLSRFSTDEKVSKSATKKFPKVYIQKDLIQSKDKEDDTVVLIKNMFSPSKSAKKAHVSNYLERSSEKYKVKKPTNRYMNTLSVVKTLDFDGKKKKKEEKKNINSKNELFDLEAQCEYQVGDLVWARMGSYPFWPCIITRDPYGGMFVKKKLFGRIERDVLHVTFFGDNGRRGWIVGTMLRKYNGQLEFENARNNFTPEAKKKDPRLYAAFFISEKKMPQWIISVEEAEMLFREPKRLRIDILNDMLQKNREIKTTPKHEISKTIVRTNSDVSLSESLLDTLFSEDDSKGNYVERSRSKSGNRTLDVSDVVTACLDNMAAKTGITKIQRQSHMDRWLQKAKSKTPEKSHLKSQLSLKIEKDIKVSNTTKLKKKVSKKSPLNKPYNFRKLATESRYEAENKLKSHQNEHDYSRRYRERNSPAILEDVEIVYENAEILTSDVIQPGSGLGIISKVETLCSKEHADHNNKKYAITTIVDDEVNINMAYDIENVQNGYETSLNGESKKILIKKCDTQPHHTNEINVIEINDKITPTKDNILGTVEVTNNENNLEKSINNGVEESNKVILKYSKSKLNARRDFDETNVGSKSTEECESHIQTRNENQIHYNVLDTSADQKVVSTRTVKKTDEHNSFNDKVLDDESIIEKGSCLNFFDKLNYNLTPNIAGNSLDKDMDQEVSSTESDSQQSDLQSKESKLSSDKNTLTQQTSGFIQSDDSIIKNERCLNFLDKKSTQSLSPVITQNRTDKNINIKLKTNIDNKNVVHNKILELSNSTENKTLPCVVRLQRGKLLGSAVHRKELKCNNFTKINTHTSNKQNLKKTVNLNTKEQAEEDPDISNNTENAVGRPQSKQIAEEGLFQDKEIKSSFVNNEMELNRRNSQMADVQSKVPAIDLRDPPTDISEKSIIEDAVCDESTVVKVKLLEKKLKSNSCSKTNKEVLNTVSIAMPNDLNSMEYADGEFNKFSKTNEITKLKSKEYVVKENLLLNKELNKSISENVPADLYIGSLKVSNVVQSKEYASDGNADLPGASTNVKNNQMLGVNRKRQTDIKPNKEDERQNDLKEFEAQLYNIFGLTSKRPTKSKSNLSLYKSSKNIESIDGNVHVMSNDESEYTESINKKDKTSTVCSDEIRNTIVNVTEISQTEKDIFTQKENCKDLNNENKIMWINCIDNNKASVKSDVSKPVAENSTEEEIKLAIVETILDKKDNDTIDKTGVPNDDSNILPDKLNLPAKQESSYDTKELFNNTDFLRYLELKQDALIDEQPDLTQEEITSYLYKTWLYEENLKTVIVKSDEIQHAKLVNGLKSPIKIKLSLNKSSKYNKKTYNVEITNDNEEDCAANVLDKKNNITDFSINNDCANINDSSPKRSKRKKRNRPNSSFEKYFLSSVKKHNNSSTNILELTPKGLNIKEACQTEIKVKPNKETNTVNNLETVPTIQNSIKNEKSDCSDMTDYVNKLSPKLSAPTQNSYYKDNIESKTASQNDLDDNTTTSDNEKPSTAHQVKLIISKNQSACVVEGKINVKKINDIEEDDDEPDKDEEDNISVQSEQSDISLNNIKLNTKEKLSTNSRKRLDEPEFLKYLELKQDALIDEHPELTEEEISNYLYKTWLYEASLKTDETKADDIESVTTLVKDLNRDSAPVKRVRKKKAEKDRQVDLNIDSEEIIRKEKSKRKTVKPYFYKEHFSDLEDDIEFFDIFKPKSKTPTPVLASDSIKNDINQINDAEVEYADETDKAEEYFRQLIAPKPNLFKGLLREKVCEICEKVDNLVKCKGCYNMFHFDCIKKIVEVVEVTNTVRGRKKKRKPRGRKTKDYNSVDSECQSDEKSQDLNASDEMLNTSVENETEPHVVVNADHFETQLSLKMKEILENPENKEYDSFSSADELDWNDMDYGECKIVDVLPRKKDRLDIDLSNFICRDCQKFDTPVCFVCKSGVSPKQKAEHRQRCQVAHCNKYYHLECLDHWPQTQFNAGELSKISKSNKLVEALTCPRHVCHTCVCDDPRGCKTRFSGDKLARCVRCPATYHTFTKCLPAGSQILTASHIICPRHYEHRPGKVPCHVNTGWCFICALGGTLICCEYCPTSFHAECLNIDPPEGGYMCEDCETGRLPLYGEMVWVKLGHYRWWPGIILHPSEIPMNILSVKHTQGEFVVRFFGQYDYYWVNRGRVFPFQEGDSGRVSSQRSKIDAAFTMAVEHAQRACEILKTASPNKEESMDIASSLLPPHYVKLRVNKPCGSLCGKKIDIEESSLTQCECDPNEFEPCGPYTQCLNRMLLTECGPTCRSGDRCNNRAFEKRLYPKMTPYRTPYRGWGLKTLDDIKAGQFVIEYVGELIDEEEFRRRMRRKQEVRDENFYYLTLDKERMIDAGPKGNLARFMNHSCEPNCETQKWTVLGDVRVGLFAMYDIPANSELTFNYNLESTGIEKKQCMCGAKRCSGYIGEKPKQDDQPKKNKQTAIQQKRTYKKRKIIELSPTTKPKPRLGRPHKPRELTEIEKDLLIIKNATNGMSSDSESSRRPSVDSKDCKGLKRKRTEDVLSPSSKKVKLDKSTEDISI